MPFIRKKEITSTPSLNERIHYLKMMVEYFERNIQNNTLFNPEYQISKEIFDIIISGNKDQTEKNNAITIAYNKISQIEHYDGSGWHDFQIRLGGYFYTQGYKADFNREESTMSLENL